MNEDLITMENKFEEMFKYLSTKFETLQKQVDEKTVSKATTTESVKNDANDD